MHPRFLYDLDGCSILGAVDEVGDGWTLKILREALYGLTRFDDFARALGCGRGLLKSKDRLEGLGTCTAAWSAFRSNPGPRLRSGIDVARPAPGRWSRTPITTTDEGPMGPRARPAGSTGSMATRCGGSPGCRRRARWLGSPSGPAAGPWSP